MLFHATNLFIIHEHITGTPGVRYEDCIKKAKQHERTVSDFKDHATSRGATGSSIPSFQDPLLTAHALQRRQKPTGRRDGACGKCGRSHERGNCPAYGTKCFKCGGMNHFKQCCRTRHSSSSSKGPSPFKKGKPQHRDRRSSGGFKGKGKRSQYQRRRRRQYTVQEETAIQEQEQGLQRDIKGKLELGPFSTT